MIRFIKKCWKANRGYTICIIVGTLDLIASMITPETFSQSELGVLVALDIGVSCAIYLLLEEVNEMKEE